MLFFVSHYTLIAASNAITPRNIALVVLILLILNLSRLSFWLVAFPFVLLHAIYLPIAKIFGKINYGFVASAFATDHAETLEFLKMLGGGKSQLRFSWFWQSSSTEALPKNTN